VLLQRREVVLRNAPASHHGKPELAIGHEGGFGHGAMGCALD
jgi:hypothetical protein